MKIIYKAMIIGIFLSIVSNIGKASDFISINGYYKSFFVVYDQPEYKLPGDSIVNLEVGAVSNRFVWIFLMIFLKG